MIGNCHEERSRRARAPCKGDLKEILPDDTQRESSPRLSKETSVTTYTAVQSQFWI